MTADVAVCISQSPPNFEWNALTKSMLHLATSHYSGKSIKRSQQKFIRPVADGIVRKVNINYSEA